jgi:signal transduction histidine kinase
VGFPLADLTLSVIFTVIAVASVLTGHPDEGPIAVTLPVAVVMTGSLAWRTRAPVISAAAVTVAALVQTLITQAPGSLWSLVVLIVVMYSVAGGYREGTAALIGLGMLALLLIQERLDNGVDYLFIAILFGGTWLLGRSSRRWLHRIRTVEHDQAQLAKLAVADERLHIARELHDTVAHSLSVIAVQAAALEHDPRLAQEPLAAISTSARRSLGEIRTVLFQLRDESDDTSRRPLLGLAQLDELVDAARHSGIKLESEVKLGADPLPPAIDRAAYRIVQESLTNVARHAPRTAAALRIEVRDRRLRIEVENKRTVGSSGASGAGVGLVGIGERAHAVGGVLEAGPCGDIFRVSVVLPLGTEPT